MHTTSRSPRRAVAATLSVLVAAATLSFAPGTAGAVGTGNEALLVDANAFFRNSYAEVGARPNGSFGSDVVTPAGWHGNFEPDGGPRPAPADQSGVGFRADREKNGWGTGADDGDFFVPGDPYESWAVQTSGTTKMNTYNSTGVPGGFVEADTSGDPSVVWDSADASSGVLVRQVQSVPADGTQQLNVDVTLTNPTGSPVEARYSRAVDADNCVQYRGATTPLCDSDGDGAADLLTPFAVFDTQNTIRSQRRSGGPTSAVGATQADGSEVVLWTAEPDSVAVMFNRLFCQGAQLTDLDALPLTSSPASPATVNCGSTVREAYTEVGATKFTDAAMAVVVKKTVPANGSVTFRVSYSLSTDAYISALTAVDLTEGPLDTMTVGTPFTFDLAATGITSPTFAVTAGTLPDGLTLDPTTGNISGTPTTAGPYDFSVTASGTEGSVTKQYTGTVDAAPGVAPTWTDNTIGQLVTGRPVTDGVTATGTGPITYLVLGSLDTLPAGLTLDPATGELTGTPTTAGPYDFTVIATNEFGSVAQRFTGTVAVPPAWTDNALAAPTVKRPYTDGVAASGSGPITYTVTGGRLPAGLALNPTSGALTGTPTTPGGSLFVITASSPYGSVTQGFSMNVAPAPRAFVIGTVRFVIFRPTPLAEGRRELDRLAASVPRDATNVRVEVIGWAESRRQSREAIALANSRAVITIEELRRRGINATYTATAPGRYPLPGPTGRRADVIISYDAPGGQIVK